MVQRVLGIGSMSYRKGAKVVLRVPENGQLHTLRRTKIERTNAMTTTTDRVERSINVKLVYYSIACTIKRRLRKPAPTIGKFIITARLHTFIRNRGAAAALVSAFFRPFYL